MIRILGNRGVAAAMGLFMMALASTGAQAKTVAQPVTQTAAQPVRSYDVTAAVRQVLPAASSTAYRTTTATTSARPAATTMSGVLQSARQAVAAVTRSLSASALSSAAAPAIAREAAWLYHAGWPLYALVDRYGVGAPLDEETACLATAVYFEARGESPEGQLAVARVVMNRAASGKYPPSWCATVKQPWQFSFVRNGRFPAINTGSDAWRKAQAVARLAVSNVVPSLSSDVLWYHANYVAPSWGRRLTRAEKIGAHIFYRA